MRQAIAVHDPLQFFAGDSWEIQFDCNDIDNQPLDLTGVLAIEWTLGTVDGSSVIMTKTLGDAITVLSPPAEGRCLLIVPAGDTAGLAPGYYRDQLRVTYGDGLVSTQTSGRVQVFMPL